MLAEENARQIVRQMPELAAFKKRLKSEKLEVRQAAVNVLSAWAKGMALMERIPDMNLEELHYHRARVKAELARRGETSSCRDVPPFRAHSSSTRYTLARWILSALAISVAPMPSAFISRTLATSIEARRPL